MRGYSHRFMLELRLGSPATSRACGRGKSYAWHTPRTRFGPANGHLGAWRPRAGGSGADSPSRLPGTAHDARGLPWATSVSATEPEANARLTSLGLPPLAPTGPSTEHGLTECGSAAMLEAVDGD